MAMPKQYESNAARQAAHRARSKTRWIEVDRAADERHHALLDALQLAIHEAAKRGDESAKSCNAASVETMLEKLTKYFEEQAR
jgi:hypothetical protein